MIHQLKSNTRHTKEGLARFHLTFFVAIAVGCFSIYAVNTWPVSHRFNLITRPERHYRILSFLWKSNRSKNCSQILCDNAIVLLETRNKSRITFFSDFFFFLGKHHKSSRYELESKSILILPNANNGSDWNVIELQNK